MTQYIYIASPTKLPSAQLGLNPVSSEQPNVFQSELDFAHLYFENNYDTDMKARFSFSSHLSFINQVTTTHNSIPLKHEWTGQRQNEIEKKCLGLLYSYLEEALQSAFIVEYFTSINGDEDLPIALKRNIYWGDIKSPTDLILEDREFWEITL